MKKNSTAGVVLAVLLLLVIIATAITVYAVTHQPEKVDPDPISAVMGVDVDENDETLIEETKRQLEVDVKE